MGRGVKAAVIIAAVLLVLAAAFALIIRRIMRLVFGRVSPETTPNGHLLEPQWRSFLGELGDSAERVHESITDRVYIRSFDGLRLAGAVIRCPDARGTVIMVHGYHSFFDVDFGLTAELCRSLGLNVLLITLRGHGESEGETVTFGLKERFDVRDWARFAEHYFPNLPIILAGISMGASSVLFAAALELPKAVKGIIADCGYTSPWDEIAYVMKHDYRLPQWPLLNIIDFIFTKKEGVSLRAASSIEAMKQCRIPVLFIHGAADRFVPCDFTIEAYRACAAKKRLLIIDSASHASSYLAGRKEYEAAVREFVGEILRGEPNG